jgi:hypothetical protein
MQSCLSSEETVDPREYCLPPHALPAPRRLHA